MPFDPANPVSPMLTADAIARIAAAHDRAALLADALPLYQRTVAAPIVITGKGIHSGNAVTMRLLPAAANAGIVFVRSDLAGDNTIPATAANVTSTMLCTTLSNAAGAKAVTVEHVMSALAGMGIDNVTIELDAAEVPVLDGSAAPYIDLIIATGITEYAAPRRALQILRPVEVVDGDKTARLLPSDAPEFFVTIVYDNPAIGTQSYGLELSPATYAAEIAESRTFALKSDVDAMHAAGLALGGGLDNAVVFDGAAVMNAEGLRGAKEPVRHKVLDAVGDLALAGGIVMGRFEGHKTGHGMNNVLLRAVLADTANYRWVDATDIVLAPSGDFTGNPYPSNGPAQPALMAAAE